LENLWDETVAKACETDLDMRVYSSNLLGRSDQLVLHGGGNTSVKSMVEGKEILYVKGSGWDLVSIKAEGFAPVRMDALLEMATLEQLSDSDMVTEQKAAMIDSTAPNPSVEAILHALIPFKVVDHTHADAIVTISNSVEGSRHIEALFPEFLIVPYVMPGFILAQKIHEMTQDFDWERCGGIILHNHGIFTFDDDAKCSYDKMIEAVSRAEAFLDANAPIELPITQATQTLESEALHLLIEEQKGHKVHIHINQTPLALSYASQANLPDFATRGVLTPEHIIRTKRIPLVLEKEDLQSPHLAERLSAYTTRYQNYFDTFATDEIMLNPAPNYAVVQGYGIILFGKTSKEVMVLNDIIEHTMTAVLRADQLGGYRSISLRDSFEMEYWELEQAKIIPNKIQ
jgi:rhamnose utilization protein RhaD (predicted bifunctional aldolase and dehydrogenase)